MEEVAHSQAPAVPAGLPSVGVCLLNWNGWRDTLECVESLRRQDYPNFLTIVLDNHSLNDSAAQIRSWAEKHLPGPNGFAEYSGQVGRAGGQPDKESQIEKVPARDRLVLICHEENTGFTGGCNAVIDYALHRKSPLDYVFLLNNDTTLRPDCLTRLMEVARECGAGIIGAVMFDETGEHPMFNGSISMNRQFFYPLVNWQFPAPVTDKDYWPTDCAHGGAMAARADVLRDVHRSTGNYLREGLFMYNECAEFHYHAAHLGHHAVVAGKALVYHKNARSSGGSGNPIAYYYTERSRLLVAKAVLPVSLLAPFHLLNLTLAAARFLKNAARGKTAEARSILEGLWDGYRGREGKWRRHDLLAARRKAA